MPNRRLLKNLAAFFVPSLIPPVAATISGALPPQIGVWWSIWGYVFNVIVYLASVASASAKRLIRRACWLLVMSLVLLVTYHATYQLWTIPDPQGGRRFSIGFGMAKWSLTERGRMLVEHERFASPGELMIADAAFYEGGPERLWKSWTIVITSTILTILFLASSITWVAAFGLLATHRARYNPG
jgi:hypothetical protein